MNRKAEISDTGEVAEAIIEYLQEYLLLYFTILRLVYISD